MAILVDKDKKRRDIALSCKSLLLDRGMRKLTISEIAKVAGVGKGTIYEYFANKDDIIFEIIKSFIEYHEKRLQEVAASDIPTKEKILSFFFLFFDDEMAKKQLSIYREYISVSLSNPADDFIEFAKNSNEKFNKIITKITKDAISKGELKEQSLVILKNIQIYHSGLIVESLKNRVYTKENINTFIDAIFELMENKNENN